jgi:hypothetical protein
MRSPLLSSYVAFLDIHEIHTYIYVCMYIKYFGYETRKKKKKEKEKGIPEWISFIQCLKFSDIP